MSGSSSSSSRRSLWSILSDKGKNFELKINQLITAEDVKKSQKIVIDPEFTRVHQTLMACLAGISVLSTLSLGFFILSNSNEERYIFANLPLAVLGGLLAFLHWRTKDSPKLTIASAAVGLSLYSFCVSIHLACDLFPKFWMDESKYPNDKPAPVLLAGVLLFSVTKLTFSILSIASSVWEHSFVAHMKRALQAYRIAQQESSSPISGHEEEEEEEEEGKVEEEDQEMGLLHDDPVYLFVENVGQLTKRQARLLTGLTFIQFIVGVLFVSICRLVFTFGYANDPKAAIDAGVGATLESLSVGSYFATPSLLSILGWTSVRHGNKTLISVFVPLSCLILISHVNYLLTVLFFGVPLPTDPNVSDHPSDLFNKIELYFWLLLIAHLNLAVAGFFVALSATKYLLKKAQTESWTAASATSISSFWETHYKRMRTLIWTKTGLGIIILLLWYLSGEEKIQRCTLALIWIGWLPWLLAIIGTRTKNPSLLASWIFVSCFIFSLFVGYTIMLFRTVWRGCNLHANFYIYSPEACRNTAISALLWLPFLSLWIISCFYAGRLHSYIVGEQEEEREEDTEGSRDSGGSKGSRGSRGSRGSIAPQSPDHQIRKEEAAKDIQARVKLLTLIGLIICMFTCVFSGYERFVDIVWAVWPLFSLIITMIAVVNRNNDLFSLSLLSSTVPLLSSIAGIIWIVIADSMPLETPDYILMILFLLQLFLSILIPFQILSFRHYLTFNPPTRLSQSN